MTQTSTPPGREPAEPIWNAARDAIVAGDAPALNRLLHDHEALLRTQSPPPYVPSGPRPDYRTGTAKDVIAREHYFASWAAYEHHRDALRNNSSPIAPFERAVDAVISGDAPALDQLLRDHPDFTKQRSTRTHHATLLHYVAANGIEGFRQKTPKNATAITHRLLSAGADVNAVASMYSDHDTTLDLVSTSIHPLLAGVQDDVLAVLLEAGATIDHTPGSAVQACIANGCLSAADFLTRRLQSRG
jgi:hypothetical protein